MNTLIIMTATVVAMISAIMIGMLVHAMVVFGMAKLSPLAAYMNNSSNPNWNKSIHINTTAEIEKSMTDAVTYVKTHKNTNMSDPSYKPENNSTKISIASMGPDIQVPLNTYNVSKINQK